MNIPRGICCAVFEGQTDEDLEVEVPVHTPRVTGTKGKPFFSVGRRRRREGSAARSLFLFFLLS